MLGGNKKTLPTNDVIQCLDTATKLSASNSRPLSTKYLNFRSRLETPKAQDQLQDLNYPTPRTFHTIHKQSTQPYNNVDE